MIGTWDVASGELLAVAYDDLLFTGRSWDVESERSLCTCYDHRFGGLWVVRLRFGEWGWGIVRWWYGVLFGPVGKGIRVRFRDRAFQEGEVVWALYKARGSAGATRVLPLWISVKSQLSGSGYSDCLILPVPGIPICLHSPFGWRVALTVGCMGH